MKKEVKKVELNERMLEKVTGGEMITYWDAMCSACGETICGMGSGCYTHEAMEDKITTYNSQGCPYCGKTGTMVEYSFTVEA